LTDLIGPDRAARQFGHFGTATLLNRPTLRRWFVVDVDLGFIGIERPPEASP
jgi:hypothetical protein